MTSELVQGILFVIMIPAICLIVLWACANGTWEVYHKEMTAGQVMLYWIKSIFNWLKKG